MKCKWDTVILARHHPNVLISQNTLQILIDRMTNYYIHWKNDWWYFTQLIKLWLFQEQLFIVKIGAIACARLAFHALTFTNKNTYVTRDSLLNMYWKVPYSRSSAVRALGMWLRGHGFKSHQGCAIFHFILFHLFQEQLFTVEPDAVVHSRLAFHVLTFTNKNTWIDIDQYL